MGLSYQEYTPSQAVFECEQAAEYNSTHRYKGGLAELNTQQLDQALYASMINRGYAGFDVLIAGRFIPDAQQYLWCPSLAAGTQTAIENRCDLQNPIMKYENGGWGSKGYQNPAWSYSSQVPDGYQSMAASLKSTSGTFSSSYKWLNFLSPGANANRKWRFSCTLDCSNFVPKN